MNNVFHIFAAVSKAECDLWVKGLRYLSHDTITSTYPLVLERWLWKEFNEMAGERSNITLKDIRTFLPQVNCQIAKQRVKKAFQEVDSRKPDELSFDDFASLYHILIHDDNVRKTCIAIII